MHKLIAATLITALGVPALADKKSDHAEMCVSVGKIYGQAVELRKKRRSERKAKAELIASVEERYADTVPMIVGDVYSRHRKDLDQDFEAAFVAQCSDIKP
jgi:hypothetical protein